MKTLYKTLKSNLTSEHENFKWEVGKWYKTEGEINLCGNGFHASKRLIDAMSYVTPEEVALVEVKGKHDIQKDKECWEYMRIVKSKKWTKEHSVKLSIYSSELVLKNFEKEFPDDKRPREAIEAAKKWLENPTEENRSAARSAADSALSAARSAADSAWSAARSADSAAMSAWSAARSAARSAESAARSAESAAYDKTLEEILDKIEKYIHTIIKI